MAAPWPNERNSEPAGSNGSTGSAANSPRRSTPIDGSPSSHPPSTAHAYSTVSPHHDVSTPSHLLPDAQDSIQPEHRRPSVVVAAPSADTSYNSTIDSGSSLLSRASAAAGLDTIANYTLTAVNPEEMQNLEMYGGYNTGNSYYTTNNNPGYSTTYPAELLR